MTVCRWHQLRSFKTAPALARGTQFPRELFFYPRRRYDQSRPDLYRDSYMARTRALKTLVRLIDSLSPLHKNRREISGPRICNRTVTSHAHNFEAKWQPKRKNDASKTTTSQTCQKFSGPDSPSCRGGRCPFAPYPTSLRRSHGRRKCRTNTSQETEVDSMMFRPGHSIERPHCNAPSAKGQASYDESQKLGVFKRRSPVNSTNIQSWVYLPSANVATLPCCLCTQRIPRTRKLPNLWTK
jgi:hypothetical protein